MAELTRKLPQKTGRSQKKTISAANLYFFVTQLALTCAGWPNGEQLALTCVQI